MLSTAENDMKRWCVDDEHAEASSRHDTSEVVVVSDNVAAEWEGELSLHREDLENPLILILRVSERKLTLKHWMMKMDKYTGTLVSSQTREGGGETHQWTALGQELRLAD